MTKDCKTTPLARAIYRNDLDMVLLLLEVYFDLNIFKLGANINFVGP